MWGEGTERLGAVLDFWQEGAFLSLFFRSFYCLFFVLVIVAFLSVFGSFWEVILGGDGKRLQACLKRLELQSKTKSKSGGFGGRAPRAWAGLRMTESAFKLA